MTKALTYIEIDVPFCANTYGIAPCTASLVSSPPTGDHKCFNTPKTCQDRANYIDAPVTFRFAAPVGYLPEDIDVIQSIASISYTPAVVSLGEDLGTRASLSVTFFDHPWPDTGPGFDKYRTERLYDPVKQGSFWGKMRARQPYLRGRPIRLIRGKLGQTLEEMETRHYIIDSFNQNVIDGTYSITAKDALKLADDDRSQAPVLSQGFLVSAISAVDTTATLSPSGIGNQEYPASGYIALGGKEIVSFVRDPYLGNNGNTKLYLQCNGTDASTSFPDSSIAGKTVTANGNAQVDTAQKKFGTGSALFDGSGDFLSVPDSNDWTFSGNFTIDFQARWNALAGTQTLFNHATDANNKYELNVSATGALTFRVMSASVDIVTLSSAAGVVAADGVWRHIAVVRVGNDYDIYVNGVSVASVNDNSAIPNFTGTLRFGANQAGSQGFNGWLDSIRVENEATWTTDFDPPTGPYQQTGEILTIIRAQLNTTAIAHDAQDRAQLVLAYEAEDVADIIRDLFVNYAGIDDNLIPIAAWRIETSAFLDRVFTAYIAEPTGVQTLLKELIEDAALSIWWDDVEPELRLRVLRSIASDAFLFDQSNYIEQTLTSREQPEERISQVWRYFAKRNPCERQDNEDNYRSVAVALDLQAETDYGSSAIKKIFSRWIPFGGRAIADKANALYLSRFRDPPRRFNFSVARNDLFTPELGQGYRIAGHGIQEDTGEATNTPIQITRLNPGDGKFDLEAEELLIAESAEADLTNRVIIIDSNTMNVNLRTLHDTLFPEPTDQDVIDGVNLTCYVESGVLIGGTGQTYTGPNTTPIAATNAFDVGTWPTGFPITLVVNGRLSGGGGKGGTNGTSGTNRAGKVGGVALYTRHNIDLEVSAGAIWGGGGGGGCGNLADDCSCGGGGGGGQTPGTGGNGTICSGTPAEAGSTGTITAGGAGGAANGNNGGAGGAPGFAGSAGQNGGGIEFLPRGSGGAAGAAIDGISFVTVTAGPGDIRGSQIN